VLPACLQQMYCWNKRLTNYQWCWKYVFKAMKWEKQHNNKLDIFQIVRRKVAKSTVSTSSNPISFKIMRETLCKDYPCFFKTRRFLQINCTPITQANLQVIISSRNTTVSDLSRSHSRVSAASKHRWDNWLHRKCSQFWIPHRNSA